MAEFTLIQATDARKLALPDPEEAIARELNEINQAINTAAEGGLTQMVVRIKSITSESVIAEMQLAGYRITGATPPANAVLDGTVLFLNIHW